MKRTILTAALAACALSATAQIMEERNPVPMTPGGGRVYRTEVVPYDARHDAEARNREAERLRYLANSAASACFFDSGMSALKPRPDLPTRSAMISAKPTNAPPKMNRMLVVSIWISSC